MSLHIYLAFVATITPLVVALPYVRRDNKTTTTNNNNNTTDVTSATTNNNNNTTAVTTATTTSCFTHVKASDIKSGGGERSFAPLVAVTTVIIVLFIA